MIGRDTHSSTPVKSPPLIMCWELSGEEENIILVYKIHSSTPQSTPPTLPVLIAHLLTEVQWSIEGQDLPQVISDISVSDSVSMIML